MSVTRQEHNIQKTTYNRLVSLRSRMYNKIHGLVSLRIKHTEKDMGWQASEQNVPENTWVVKPGKQNIP